MLLLLTLEKLLLGVSQVPAQGVNNTRADLARIYGSGFVMCERVTTPTSTHSSRTSSRHNRWLAKPSRSKSSQVKIDCSYMDSKVLYGTYHSLWYFGTR